jgi:hypothetical protein
MTTYEQCMKVGVVLNRFTLNRWSQKGHGPQGHGGKDYMTNTEEAPSGCDEQRGERANGPKKDEGTN